MARDMFKFVNTVGWKNDLESFRRLKKEVRGFKKEIDNLYKGINKNIPKNPFMGGGGYKGNNHQHLINKQLEKNHQSDIKREEDLYNLRRSNQARLQSEQNKGFKGAIGNLTSQGGSSPAKNSILADMLREEQAQASINTSRLQSEQNNRVRGAVSGLTSGGSGTSAKNSTLADMLRQEDAQAKINSKQEEMIKNFMISNRQIRQMSEEEKEILRTRLKQTSSVKELRYEMRKIKTTLSDNLATQKKFTREQEKQNALAKRANASYMQLGTSIASVYTALAAGQSIVRTGIAIESINKTLLSVTGNSTLAAEEMKFLESEASRLGLSLQDGGKAYAKLLAAGKGKLPTEDIRDMFTAVSEAGTVLGLSQDDMSGGIRAIQQMLSKGKIQAEELSHCF